MVSIKDLYSDILTGLHAEPPLETMKRKLIINVAPTGSFTCPVWESATRTVSWCLSG